MAQPPKYTEADRELIRTLHTDGLSTYAIARAVGCSDRFVTFVLDPESYASFLAAKRARKEHLRYYDRERHTAAVARSRAKKKAAKRAQKTS